MVVNINNVVMKRSKQLELELINYRSQIGKGFGGNQKKGHPKGKRPFSSKHFTHLVLKSSYAKGKWSFLHYRNKSRVDRLVFNLAKKCGVQIRDYVNVGNHLHLLVKASDRVCVTRFLRSLTGILPRLLCGCEKGRKLGFSFWTGRPYTKIIASGWKPFNVITRYFEKNRNQAEARFYLEASIEGNSFARPPNFLE